MEPITGSWTTMLGILALVLAGVAFWMQGKYGKIEARPIFALAGIAGAGMLLAWAGMMPAINVATTAPYTGTPGTPGYTTTIPADAGISTIITDDVPRIVDNLNIRTTEASSGKTDQCEGEILYFASGEDPRLSTSYTIDTTTMTAGKGTDTSGQLETNTKYHIIYHNASTPATHYDGVLGMGVWNPSDPLTPVALKAPSTTDAEVSAIIKYGEDGTAPLWKVATIPDCLNEAAVDGSINGQTSTATIAGGVTATANWNSTNEVQIGADSTPADDDIVYYNDTNGDGSFTLRLTFGAEGSQSFLKRPVLCFVNDMSAPCERNEFTAITASVYTGSSSEVSLPSDLLPSFNNMDSCVEIGGESTDGVAYISSGMPAVYTLTFSVDESKTDGLNDKFYIIEDDLGGYLAQDIRQGQGASASSSTYLTCSFRD